jgi:hypothetical protein
MRSRSSLFGLIATVAVSLPSHPAPSYTLEAEGALRLASSGQEARYGLMRDPSNGRAILEISLGATQGEAALSLFTYADSELRPGRYPVAMSLPEGPSAGRRFHPCFVAGTVQRPVGFFHGETGWVAITGVGGGRITGEYEIRARGYLASNMDDENQWVTLRGTFVAAGDSTATVIPPVAAASQ